MTSENRGSDPSEAEKNQQGRVFDQVSILRLNSGAHDPYDGNLQGPFPNGPIGGWTRVSQVRALHSIILIADKVVKETQGIGKDTNTCRAKGV